MLGTGLELLAILALIAANGVFAMSEIAVVSARRALLKQKVDEGSRNARIALDLATNPNDFLSTVQVGITLIGTMAGAFGGATIAFKLGAALNRLPWIAPHGETVALGVVVVVISYLSLILGELVPKRLALANPEMVASAMAPSMRLLARVAAPGVRFLSMSSGVVLRLLAVRAERGGSEEEIRSLIAQGARSGAFQEGEQEMLAGVLRLGDRRIGELMTPRQNIVWLEARASAADIRQVIAAHIYSRYPVAEGSLDRVVGVVHVKDLAGVLMEGRRVDLRAVARPVQYIPELTRALRAIQTFQKSRNQLALVVDEHGGVEGLITLTDLVEAIVGDLPSHGEAPEPKAARGEDGSWIVDGMMPLFAFKERLGIEHFAGAEEGVTTLGGFVMARLGRVPEPADSFEHDGLRYEVIGMDGRRVDKVLIREAEPAARATLPATPDDGPGPRGPIAAG
jgi:putative hemolysin